MEMRPRPKITDGKTERIHLQCGNIYVTTNFLDGQIFEVFAVLGRSGGCAHSQLSALTLAITIGVRSGVAVGEYIDKLKGVVCPSLSIDEGVTYLSCPDAIARVLERDQKRLNDERKGQGGVTS